MFLEEKTPTDDDIQAAIRRATISRKFTPVLVGSALKNKGVQPLLDAAVDYLPNPTQVTNYALDSSKMVKDEEGEDVPIKLRMNPERSDNHPFVGLAFKLEQGKFGQLTYLRVYQGLIRKGDSVINTRSGKKTRVPRLIQMHADKMEDISEGKAGDICALFGIDCASGDTFVVEKASQNLSMESIYVPDPVISLSLKVNNKKDGDNFMKAVQRFTKEDPTYRVWFDNENKETLASGMGELHLEIYAQRMEREYNCPVTMGKPVVAFRETLTNRVEFDYQHKKQTGGRGEFARGIGVMEPLPANENTKIEFWDETTGTNVPKPFVPGVKKGFEDSCQKGLMAGQKVVGVRMRLQDGANHQVDSSEWAFYQASQAAFAEVSEDGIWQLLEPVMSVEVNSPNEFTSGIFSLITGRSGIITGQDGRDDWFTLEAEVPLNNMFGFSAALRSATQGKGEFTMEYSRYAPAAVETQDKVVEEYKKKLEQEAGPQKGI